MFLSQNVSRMSLRDPRPPAIGTPPEVLLSSGAMAQEKGIDELAREHAPNAVTLLAEIMDREAYPFIEARDRIRAAEAILDRGYGKPSQAIIQVPANRQQAALLASLSDDQLVAVIEQKQLPSLRQPMITIDAPKRIAAATHSGPSGHGAALDVYGEDLDPLLL